MSRYLYTVEKERKREREKEKERKRERERERKREREREREARSARFPLIRLSHGELICLSRYFRRRLAVLHRVHAPGFDPVRGSREEWGHGEGSGGGRTREGCELKGREGARWRQGERVGRTPVSLYDVTRVESISRNHSSAVGPWLRERYRLFSTRWLPRPLRTPRARRSDENDDGNDGDDDKEEDEDEDNCHGHCTRCSSSSATSVTFLR